MTRLVAWVLAAVFAALAAGFGVGLATCRAAAVDAIELQAGDVQVVERFTADLGLRAEQVVLLRAILRHLQDAKGEVLRRNAQRLPQDVRKDLDDVAEAADKRISFMLDAGQRARYEQQRKTETSGR
jgi:hypothetical protein